MLLLLFFSLFFTKAAYAADTFQLNQNIIYAVDQNGKASVEQDMTLTNNMPEVYPTEYEINAYGSDITSFTATDKNGNILKTIEKGDNSSKIKLKFNVQIVGKGQTTPFTIRYIINKFAENRGNVWEINLPEYQNITQSDQITLTLKIPTKFGRLAFSSVALPDTSPLQNYYQIHLNQNQIKDKKNLFIFGDYQLFDFNLKYKLTNNSSDTTATKIAIPPNLDSQKIVFKTIAPPPEKIDIDQDGNWLAQYTLKPQETINVIVDGQAKIINSQYLGTSTKELLVSSQFWPVDDETIKSIAATLNTPKNIYDYVIKTLSYNFDGIASATRQGALNALLEPSKALCTEFTDLFVTLCRAKGIPAREIEGFAYTNNPKLKPISLSADILHAWPQYFDKTKQSWIAIDPTWGKTTNGIDYFHDLDLNHLIFVIHGLDSQFPSTPDSATVTFASTEILPENKAPLITTDTKNIIIENNNSNPLFQTKLSIATTNWQTIINFIGPYDKITLPLPKMPLLTKSVIILLNNETPYTVKYMPYYQNLIIASIGAIILLCICGIIITRHEKIS